MSLVAKRHLSGGSHGRNIKVAATATPGTTVHTAVAGTTDGTYDEVWLYACNSSTSPVKITIEFGGTTSPDDTIEVTIRPECGFVNVIPGLPLRNGGVVRAFAGTTNVLLVNGFVNKITA
jgi:hypothetical protein